MNALAERRDFVPAFNAAPPAVRPRRLQRPRKRAPLPPNTVYVGRPTLWGNPFERRPGIGHARSVLLYREWLRGNLSPYVLSRAKFSTDEIEGLRRWRHRLLEQLDRLVGRDLQCWCPTTSAWCHADELIAFANERRRLPCAA